jgi:predicted ATPase
MFRIAHVQVEGFWGTYRFDFSLDPQVNFLIGQNGTGKTTLINLVAAALTADFPALDRIEFGKLILSLKDDRNESASIIVTKTQHRERAFESIEYQIVKDGNSKIHFSLGDIEEELILRLGPEQRYRKDAYYRRMLPGVMSHLQSLVLVNWLSIHRTPPRSDRTRGEGSYESTVDLKLDALSNELVRYFSILSKRKDDDVRQFQEAMFLSLLEQHEPAKKKSIDVASLDDKLEKHKGALASIFKELHVSEAKTSKLLKSFSERGSQVNKKIASGSQNINFDDLIFLNSLRRIDEIVNRWSKLQEQLSTVFTQQNKFLTIANSLLQRKEMVISDSNELQFISRSKKLLTTQMLSSGEKQLLILLSETLLQREETAIFIADEPELSLHVLWQEKLISSLRSLNPSTQIVVATHSPDIVGPLVQHAIDMEKIIQ